MRSLLTTLLLVLAVVLLLHILSIMLYNHHHYDSYSRHYNINNKDYISAIDNLNSSLTYLHFHLQQKKNQGSLLNESQKTSLQQQHHHSTTLFEQSITSNHPNKNRKALLFTMDSITDYESNSMIGGASGKIS